MKRPISSFGTADKRDTNVFKTVEIPRISALFMLASFSRNHYDAWPMDQNTKYLLKQIIVEMRGITKNLSLLTATIKHEKCKDVDCESCKNTCKSFPDFPIPIMSIPPTPNDQERAEQKKENRRKTIKFWAEVVGVFVLFVYTIYTIKIYSANKKSADAAKSAADTAHDTLVASNRSWVGQSGPISLNFFNGSNKQLAVNIHLLFENFGHSPAISVFEDASLVPYKDLPRVADLTCNFARAQAGIKVPGIISSESTIKQTGQTIFPQQKFGSMVTSSMPTYNSEVLYVVGCVVYRDDVTDGIWWTRFCQETPWLASSYKPGQPLVTCNVYNETGKYEKSER